MGPLLKCFIISWVTVDIHISTYLLMTHSISSKRVCFFLFKRSITLFCTIVIKILKYTLIVGDSLEFFLCHLTILEEKTKVSIYVLINVQIIL